MRASVCAGVPGAEEMSLYMKMQIFVCLCGGVMSVCNIWSLNRVILAWSA